MNKALDSSAFESRYEIVEKIGGGGMGVVYKARDQRLGRTVALKFLPEHHYADPDSQKRFVQEARAASALEHPNVCTIFDIGERSGGEMYISMPLYPGQTLRELLANGKQLETSRVRKIGAQIASGLAAAHAAGIVHRDVKPANVIVTDEDRAVILDFGLAKLDSNTLVTKEGTTLGTIAYMSPEQASGGATSEAVDVWALGVLLYEAFSGMRPFPAEYEQAVIYGILNEDPKSLGKIVEDLPPGVADLVMRMLNKQPEARPSAVEVRDVLAGAGSGVRPGLLFPYARGRNRTKPVVMVVGTVVAAALIAFAWLRAREIGQEATNTIDSIAVLPMKNVSGDEEQEYFADGLTEELINKLSQTTDLKVAARTSSFSFKGKEVDVREIGERLGVRAVLESSVRKSGSKLRVSAQLIDIVGGYALWSETYDRTVSDVFAIQDEIAQSIARELRASLTQSDSRSEAIDNVDAYEAYMKGLYFWNRRTKDGLSRAVTLFREAIDRDPTYAKAHAGLANAYCIMGFYDWMKPAEAFPLCRAAAESTLELDPNSSEAYTAIGYVELYYEWNPEASEASFKKAIALDARNAVASQWYGNLLMTLGRFDEAWARMDHAHQIDPLALIVLAARGWTSYHAGKYADAIRDFQATIDLDSTFGLAHMWMAFSMERQGRKEEALRRMAIAVPLLGRSPFALASSAYLFASAGRSDTARAIIQELESERPEHYVPAFELAKAHFMLGDDDGAYAWLETALQERSHSMVFLMVDPQFEGWRDGPRFRDIVRRVGFARTQN